MSHFLSVALNAIKTRDGRNKWVRTSRAAERSAKMKKFAVSLCVIILLLFSGTQARALTVTWSPTPSDLNDLAHQRYYTWGINWSVPAGEYIVSASLSFDNIYNWRIETNDLWVHLLDSAALGVSSSWDGQGGGDNFAGQGVLLNHWQNLPTTPQDITYDFSLEEIAALSSFVGDGNFGLGFDPDCHFYNSGVSLSVSTAPEPATMLLLGSGLIGLGVVRRRFRKK